MLRQQCCPWNTVMFTMMFVWTCSFSKVTSVYNQRLFIYTNQLPIQCYNLGGLLIHVKALSMLHLHLLG